MLFHKSAMRVSVSGGGCVCLCYLTEAFVLRTRQFPFVFSLKKPNLALDAASQSETRSSRSLVPTICIHFLPHFVLGQ